MHLFILKQKNSIIGQVDFGRYLAKDWGSTFTLMREFNNGWRLGAYATFTDIPFETFGEGSFDKGIFFKIPFDTLIGKSNRNTGSVVLRPITRDGGAIYTT